MPISKDFCSVIFQKFEINFSQCTPNRLLKTTELCNLLQLTAAAHSELGGISFADLQPFNQAWVLSRMKLKILQLPKWKDEVTVKTWIVNLVNSRSTRGLEVFVAGEKIAEAETFWVIMNTEKRRPEALCLPHEHFTKFTENPIFNGKLDKIIVSKNFDFVANKTVRLSDLDFVNHVNHVKYLEWCLDFIDEKLIINHQIESIEMNFIKELSLNDKVSISNKRIDNEIFFGIEKDEKTCFVLRISLKD